MNASLSGDPICSGGISEEKMGPKLAMGERNRDEHTQREAVSGCWPLGLNPLLSPIYRESEHRLKLF